MKLEEIKKLKKGTAVVSYTTNTWIEGTLIGLNTVINLGTFTDLYEAYDAIASNKGRKQTKVKIMTDDGEFVYVSPKTVHVDLSKERKE